MKLINSIIIGAALLAGVLFIRAQDPGAFAMRTQAGAFLTGGTNAVGTSSTNTYAAFDCSDYSAFDTEFTFKAMASATSTVQVYGYRSCGLSKFETTPSYSTLVTLNGTTEVTTIHDITNLYGTASYKFVIGNTNASVAVTNVTAVNRFKAPLKTVIGR